jgi:hypothetical protein
VSVRVTVIAAPGTAEPLASCTVPFIWAVETACPHATAPKLRPSNALTPISLLIFIEILRTFDLAVDAVRYHAKFVESITTESRTI